jgi:hypothetical protein
MTFFAGLYSYESVLLVLGVILFLVLLIALLRFVFTNKPYLQLLPFFLLPIAMIGYPSIQSIEYNNGLVTIQKTTDELVKNPNDQTLRANLQVAVNHVSSRPAPSDQATAYIAKAQFALGDEEAAKANLAKVGPNSSLPDVHELQEKIQLVNQLKTLSTQVEAKPEDTAARTELANTAAQLKRAGVANPAALTSLQHAEALLAAKGTETMR